MVKINPKYAEGYNNLGNVHFELSEFDKSLDCYKKAIKLTAVNDPVSFIVDRIPVDDEALLKYLVDNNVRPGQTGIVKLMNKSAHTITIACSGLESVFGLDVANLIWIIPK